MIKKHLEAQGSQVEDESLVTRSESRGQHHTTVLISRPIQKGSLYVFNQQGLVGLEDSLTAGVGLGVRGKSDYEEANITVDSFGTVQKVSRRFEDGSPLGLIGDVPKGMDFEPAVGKFLGFYVKQG